MMLVPMVIPRIVHKKELTEKKNEQVSYVKHIGVKRKSDPGATQADHDNTCLIVTQLLIAVHMKVNWDYFMACLTEEL